MLVHLKVHTFIYLIWVLFLFKFCSGVPVKEYNRKVKEGTITITTYVAHPTKKFERAEESQPITCESRQIHTVGGEEADRLTRLTPSSLRTCVWTTMLTKPC